MMEFIRNCNTLYSKDYGEDVHILEYRSNDNTPYCDCSRCGRPIRRRMFVIQSAATDIELAYLGSECLRYFK